MFYHDYVTAFSNHAAQQIHELLSLGGRLFLVDKKQGPRDKESNTLAFTRLSDIYLLNIDPNIRENYNCPTCKNFINKYGRLVGVHATGERVVIGWTMPDELIPDEFKLAHKAVIEHLNNARITGPFFLPKSKQLFLDEDVILGEVEKGGHEHLHIGFPTAHAGINNLHKANDMNAGAVRDGFNKFVVFLIKTPQEIFKVIDTYVGLGEIARNNKFGPVFKNVARLSEYLKISNNPNKLDLIWHHFMIHYYMFKGFKNTVVGELINDLVNDRPIKESIAAFNERVDGLNYMRPTAEASDVLIDEAEDFIIRNGYDKSLKRRNATMDDVSQYVEWRPTPQEEKETSFLGNLKDSKKQAQVMYADDVVIITYSQFKETVLPMAEAIEIILPNIGNMSFVTEAVYREAPCILKYDKPENRNTLCYVTALNIPIKEWVASATYNNCSKSETLVTVSAIFKIQIEDGDSWFWVLDDVQCKNDAVGHCIFPETLIPEFHKYRKVIEAYSKITPLHDVDGSSNRSIAGFCLSTQQASIDLSVTVTFKGNIKKTYFIDRGI